MPSFWNTSPSSSNYASQDFSDTFSPASSNASLFRRNASGQFSDSCDPKRRNSQAGMTDALISPRHILSPSSSTILQPSQSASIVGGNDKRSTLRYVPRQTSLDSSYTSTANNLSPFSNNDRNIPMNRNPSYEMTIDSFDGNIPQELSYVTLRRPRKKPDFESSGLGNTIIRQSSNQSIEGPKTHFPLKRQMSGSSSTSTIGNLIENDIPVRSGLEYGILKDKCNNGRQNVSSVKNGSSYSSICSTLGENDENS